MIVAGRRFVTSALLLVVACLALMPLSLSGTYAIGDALGTIRSTNWPHNGNYTGGQHTWQRTSWQRTSWQRNTANWFGTYTRTATFTHSSSTVIRTFTQSPRTFSHTFGPPVTVTETAVYPIPAPCYPGYPGCPNYYTYYQAPPTPPDSCYTGTPGYPYNCYPSQIVTPVPSTPTSAVTGGIPLVPVNGATEHDIWLIITPLSPGQFAVVLIGQGLQQNGVYLIEGVTRATPTATVPIATTLADSEFTPDTHGEGMYWHVLPSDPQATYTQVLLIHLPNMQMQGSQLVANASLG